MKTASPCLGVPLPGGRPAPSGPMLMSHAASSSGVAMRPRFGPSAAACQTKPSVSTTSEKPLRVDMHDLSALGDTPAGNAVEVIDGFVAAPGDQLGAGRLDVAGVIAR